VLVVFHQQRSEQSVPLRPPCCFQLSYHAALHRQRTAHTRSALRCSSHAGIIFQRCCRCPCRLDGFMGPNCALEGAQTCVNQCNGRGKCNQGFCMCDTGWYGHDCSQAAAGVGGVAVQPPANVVPVLVNPLPARQHGPARPERRRPLVYVYDMDPEYNSRWGDGRMCGHCISSGGAERSACCRVKLNQVQLLCCTSPG
jgi:hypothetical protein